MESLVRVDSTEMSCSSDSQVENMSSSAPPSSRPPHHPSAKHYRHDRGSSGSHAVPKDSVPKDHIMKTIYAPSGSMVVSKRSYKTSYLVMRKDGDIGGLDEGKEKGKEDTYNAGNRPEIDDKIDQRGEDAKICYSNGVEPVKLDSLPAKEPQVGTGFCQSPQGSFYSATQYAEAKESFTNTGVSECGKSESGEVSNSCDFVFESRKD